MKYLLVFSALLAMIGFVGVSRAADAKAAKPKKGHFVKVEDMVVTYKGGLKGTGKDHTVKIDDKTKITLDGKDAKIADLKAEVYIEVTEADGVATLIAASTVTPTETPKKPAEKVPAEKAPAAK